MSRPRLSLLPGLGSLLAVGACGPPPGPDHPDWLNDGARARGGCTIEGDGTGESLRILAPGVPPFDVSLGAHSLVLVQLEAGMAPRARFVGPHLESIAEADPTDFRYHLRDPVQAAQGMLAMEAGALVTGIVRAVGAGEVLATVAPAWGLELQAVLPCQALAPGRPWREPEREEEVLAAGPEQPMLLAARGTALRLFALPDDPLQLHLGGESLPFTTLVGEEIRDGWVRVSLPGDGMVLRGWVEERSVRAIDGWMGRGGGSLGCCLARRAGAGVQVELRTLPVGTVVHAAPGQGPWLRVRSPVEVTIEREPGSAWALAQGFPDLSTGCAPRHLWVSLPPPD